MPLYDPVNLMVSFGLGSIIYTRGFQTEARGEGSRGTGGVSNFVLLRGVLSQILTHVHISVDSVGFIPLDDIVISDVHRE